MSRRMRKVARLLAASVVVAAAPGCDTAYPDSPLEWKSESAGPLASASAPKKKPAKPAPTAKVEAKKEPQGFARLDRATFNRMAVRLNQPVYWVKDANGDGVVDPNEVAALLFYPTEGAWVDGGKFTDAFNKTYEKLVEASKATPSGPDAERQKLLIGELDAAASVPVVTKTAGWTDQDKKLLEHMLKAAKLIDELHAIQLGLPAIADKVAKDDASQSVFRRDWSVRCKTPKFEKNEACTAAPGMGDPPVAVFPAEAQKSEDFCKKLQDSKKAELTDPFTVVVDKEGKLAAQGYEKAFAEPMKKIAEELRAAATDLTDPKETAMVDYLKAAATAFEDNKWFVADEAWAKMDAHNSKWYLRVGPDETYWGPCSIKAGFHLTFARVGANELQDKLTPLEQEMEDNLAKLIGDGYKARKVGFKLPDSVEIIINAGDDRDPVGATVGQSLPNWGPVAEGHGRTIVMTNLYMDPDSVGVRKDKAMTVLSAEAMKDYVDEGGPGVLGTVLHEATHNIGPSHGTLDGKKDGKKEDDAFGGDLASTLEELKAQCGAYYYLFLMQDKGLLTDDQLRRTIVDNLVWSLGHISRGMKDGAGKRKPYSQLAAIQVGFFMDEGVFIWDEKATAANGTDKGAFKIDFTKMKDASIKLMKMVGTIKAKGDKKGALELADKYVDEATSKVPHAAIRERILRFALPNFVYTIEK